MRNSYFRNSKNIVQKVTGGESKKVSKSEYSYSGGNTIMDYEKVPHAIAGAKVRQYGPEEYSHVSEAVTAAIKDLCDRLCSSSFTIICDIFVEDIAFVLRSLRQRGHDTIFYIHDKIAAELGVTSATEERMKEWLNDRRNTILITRLDYCRGWEDSSIIVIDNGQNVDNMCMRSVSNLSIVNANARAYEKASEKTKSIQESLASEMRAKELLEKELNYKNLRIAQLKAQLKKSETNTTNTPTTTTTTTYSSFSYSTIPYTF